MKIQIKCILSHFTNSTLNVQTMSASGKTLHEGDWISLNGSTGEVVLGKQPLEPPAISGDLGTFMSWVDQRRKLKVLFIALFEIFDVIWSRFPV